MSWVISLHIRSTWETICDAQAGFCTHSSGFCTHSSNSKFLSKFSRKALSGISDQKAPPPPQWKTSDLKWPKFTPEYPPPMKNFRFEMTKVYSRILPPMKNFRFEMTKVYSRILPPMKNFRFEMTKVYSRILPPMKNFRFEMTKVYSRILPQWKTSYLRWPKFTLEYPSSPPPPIGLQSWRSYVETNLYPLWIPLIRFGGQISWVIRFGGQISWVIRFGGQISWVIVLFIFIPYITRKGIRPVVIPLKLDLLFCDSQCKLLNHLKIIVNL